MKYYFLVGYLPELQRDDRKIRVGSSELLDEKYHFAAEDWKEIELILMGGDVFMVEKLLLGKAIPVVHALHTVEFWREQMKSPQEGPEFMLEFLKEFGDMAAGPSPKFTDRLYGAYYDHVLSETRNEHLRRYFGFDRDLRNILTAIRSRKKGWNPADHIVGQEEGEPAESLRQSNAEDFGLGKDYPWLERLITEDYPLKRQDLTEQIRWDFLDENTGNDPFHFNTILSYLLKVEMLEKRLALSEEQGMATVRKLEGR